MRRFAALFMLGLCLTCWMAGAQPPAELDYQGKVLVNDLPFTGDGCFKFAIANEDASLNLWANDGTSVGEPSGMVSNPVFNGVFSTTLGAPPMSPIDPSIFSLETNLYLRVWFSPTNGGFSEMLPAQKVVSAPYALNAGLLGGLSATEIHDNSVADATNGITLAGDVNGSPYNNVLGSGVIYNDAVNASADIEGSKIVQGTTSARGTLQLAPGSTGEHAIATGHPDLNAFGVVNTLTSAAPGSALSIVGVGPVFVSNQAPNQVQIGLAGGYPLPPLDHVIWVATNGTFAGPGTIDKPFVSPQSGYDYASMLSVGQPAAVVIAAGSYAGGILAMAGNVHIFGCGQPDIQFLQFGAPVSPVLQGYQRAENIRVRSGTTILPTATGVKLYNNRLASPEQNGLTINGSTVTVQNCYIEDGVTVGNNVNLVWDVGIYHSGMYLSSEAKATMIVYRMVRNFEVLWCEIVNNGSQPAIFDTENLDSGLMHLYAHNWIKGPAPEPNNWAVKDNTMLPGATIAFLNNTVYGNVGQATPGQANAQFYGNNMVYGLINHAGGTIGWTQAGIGTGADAANNTEHQTQYPMLMPSAYRD